MLLPWSPCLPRVALHLQALSLGPGADRDGSYEDHTLELPNGVRSLGGLTLLVGGRQAGAAVGRELA